ncbi:hypothetical protein [Limnobaculum zhutongyuii]|uniref:hypothetical protein n=1 Tax=Limnobaculum zhutongyuii TaxID=2498113 RepID=UPI00143D0812|nr:hypothetical protein [Limnobaculum zhutongyuii]
MDKLISLGDGVHVMASQIISVELKSAYFQETIITLTDGRIFTTYKKDIASEINEALRG